MLVHGLPTTKEQTVVALFNQASEHAKNNQMDLAKEQAQKALAILNTSAINPEAKFEQAIELLKKKKFQEAKQIFLEVVDQNSKNKLAIENLAYIHHVIEKDYMVAVTRYQQALNLDPNDIWAIDGLGVVYQERKQYKEAEAQFRHAMTISPQSIEPVNDLTRLYLNMGKPRRDVKAIYLKALELNSKSVSLLYSFANFLSGDSNESAEAERYYNKALILDPKYAYAFDGLAGLSKSKGNEEEAERLYKKAIEADSTDAWAPFQLALLYHYRTHMPDYDQAEQFYKQAIELAPEDAYRHVRYADLLCMIRQKYDDAESEYHKALTSSLVWRRRGTD